MVNGHLELVSSLLIRAIVRDVDTIEAVCVCGGGGGVVRQYIEVHCVYTVRIKVYK